MKYDRSVRTYYCYAVNWNANALANLEKSVATARMSLDLF
jgi:hypothetical protein